MQYYVVPCDHSAGRSQRRRKTQFYCFYNAINTWLLHAITFFKNLPINRWSAGNHTGAMNSEKCTYMCVHNKWRFTVRFSILLFLSRDFFLLPSKIIASLQLLYLLSPLASHFTGHWFYFKRFIICINTLPATFDFCIVCKHFMTFTDHTVKSRIFCIIVRQE